MGAPRPVHARRSGMVGLGHPRRSGQTHSLLHGGGTPGRAPELRAEVVRDFGVPGIRWWGPSTGDWTVPVESVAADTRWYAAANQQSAPPEDVKGFRDPSYFQDPADGREYLLFTGTAAWNTDPHGGLIGLAARTNGQWEIRPPLISALGVTSELERPHIVTRKGRYYLFWSTHARRFAPGLNAPTGLYAMTATEFGGPWTPVNGSGLVAANPPERQCRPIVGSSPTRTG